MLDGLSSLLPGSFFFPLIEKALSMLVDKVICLDGGYKNYLFVSIAYGLLQTQEWPSQSHRQKYEAIERVTRLYYTVRASRGDSTRPDMVGNGATEVFKPTS